MQADTIIPEQSQGTQAWDRFAYVNNNPVRYDDPTGYCINSMNCIDTAVGLIKAFGFLAMRAIGNGEIINDDWEDAADFGLPAQSSARGSKMEIGVAGSTGVVVTGSISLVTTVDGDAQLFYEYGGGIATPQLDVFATDGLIFGDLNSAKDYEGWSTQLSGGPSVGLIGVTGSAWIADGAEPSVGGVDSGGTGGPGLPFSLGLTRTKAVPTDISRQLEGAELLFCRAASMCGR